MTIWLIQLNIILLFELSRLPVIGRRLFSYFDDLKFLKSFKTYENYLKYLKNYIGFAYYSNFLFKFATSKFY